MSSENGLPRTGYGCLASDFNKNEIPDDPCPSTEEEKDALNKTAMPDGWNSCRRSWRINVILRSLWDCLHLPGEEGLIEGLRKQGYTVEAVK